METEIINAADLNAALAKLEHWRADDEKLYREYVFKDFLTAMAFMQAVSTPCEALNHHPDWQNSYNRVRIWLTTHDSGGITDKDLQLAAEISAIAEHYLQRS